MEEIINQLIDLGCSEVSIVGPLFRIDNLDKIKPITEPDKIKFIIKGMVIWFEIPSFDEYTVGFITQHSIEWKPLNYW